MRDLYFPEPKSSRFLLALRRLTLVKAGRWLFNLLGQVLYALGRFFVAMPKFFGWFFLDIAYGLKKQGLDWQTQTRQSDSRFKASLIFLLSALWLLPQSLFRFFTRLEKVTVKPVKLRSISFEKEKREEVATRPPLLWSLVNFSLTLIILISPIVVYGNWRWLETIKTKVMGSGASALEQLLTAQELLGQRNPLEAQKAFSHAGQNFLQAQSDLSAINSFLLKVARLIPNDSAQLAGSSQHVIRAGQLSSQLGEQLSGALILPTDQPATVMNMLQNFIKVAEPAVPIARDLEFEMTQIDQKALPAEYQAQFADLSNKVSFLVASLEESISLGQQARSFLGEDIDKRYMLVFQNNAEKRGPGGFIGSFATIDVRRGEITNITVPKGGTYDTEAGLDRLVAAPQPLWLLNPRWHFWDANWWPDWPTSAKKLMWFYEHSNGPSVDGVISFTPTVLERLLKVIGPIDMTKDYGVVIDAENFWTVTQTFSEQKPDVTTEPKKIIGDLMNQLLAELPHRLTPEKTVELIKIMEETLNEKLILIYMTDPDLEATVQRFNWGGEIKSTSRDYVMVVNTNIGGQKTDRVINEHIKHDAHILNDGSIIDTVTIRREHTGLRGEEFIGVRNVDWVRVYVPEGSTLLSASGFQSPDTNLFETPDPQADDDSDLAAEFSARVDDASGTKIYTEQGKTVFANWSMLDPGESEILTFQYRLPFTLKAPEPLPGLKGWWARIVHPQPSLFYTLLAQKQPGALTTTLQSTVAIEGNPDITWVYPSEAQKNQGWSVSKPLVTDFFGAILYN